MKIVNVIVCVAAAVGLACARDESAAASSAQSVGSVDPVVETAAPEPQVPPPEVTAPPESGAPADLLKNLTADQLLSRFHTGRDDDELTLNRIGSLLPQLASKTTQTADQLKLDALNLTLRLYNQGIEEDPMAFLEELNQQHQAIIVKGYDVVLAAYEKERIAGRSTYSAFSNVWNYQKAAGK